MKTETQRQEEADFLDVPALDPVPLEILALLEDEEFEMRALAGALGKDPSISQQLIRLASSPIYGASQKFVDLTQAVVYLGLRTGLTIGLGFSLFKCMRQGYGTPPEQWCWQRALINSVAAQHLAGKTHACPTDQAFLTGLTQDFGLQLLVQQRPSLYCPLLDEFQQQPEPFENLEWRQFGYTHAIVSEALLEAWKFPPESARLVGQHHDPTVFTDGGPLLVGLPTVAEGVSDFLLGPSLLTYRALETKVSHWLKDEVLDLARLLDAVLVRVRNLADILQVGFAERRGGTALIQEALAEEEA